MEILRHPNIETVQIEVSEKEVKKWAEMGWLPTGKPATTNKDRKVKNK